MLGEELRPTEMKSALDETTVQGYFDKVNDGYEKSVKEYKKLLLDVANAYTKKQRESQEELAKKLASDNSAEVKMTGKYREQLAKEIIKEEEKRQLDLQNKLYKKQLELDTKLGKEKHKQELINAKETNKQMIEMYKKIVAEGGSLTELQAQDLKEKEKDVKEANKAIVETWKKDNISKTLNNLMSQSLNVINSAINTYVGYQTGFNARIQGTNMLSGAERLRYGFNAFSALEQRITKAVGVQPYVRTEDMLKNLSELVSQGISANVEQRAFLNTVKDNIATTFNVAQGSLLRIIRLQQADSTAIRLGMEAYLTRFLNNMVENTEYLNQTFDTVSDALLEASSQMGMKQSTEFEYVVQKWLGALTGTGLSEATSQGIAQALGYLGSGNISALSSSNMQNLLVMAASRAGLDYSDMLTRGLNASTTNALMRAIADYMVEIGSNSNNVVRSQMAQTFGLSISDLTAAKALSSSFGDISKSLLSSGGMYNELIGQVSTMPLRMSTAQMLQNMFDNSLFGLATNIASSPVLSAMWKITDMIQSTTGGIELPSVFAMGSGFNLNASVEQLMKLGIVGMSSLGMIGDIVSGLSSSIVPSSMLYKLGISSAGTLRRGGGLNGLGLLSGLTNSISAIVGNASGSDIGESVVAAETADVKKQVDEEQAEKQKDSPEQKTYDLLETSIVSAIQDISRSIDDIKNRLIVG